ncbi:MAG TPA: shikimate kinase [Methylomirabilota bacterium]|nr:shikimate kinase [Methylomirabilota bacterium]
MTAPRNVRNIALCGFMGTGKSSVGRLVAEQLRFAFLDTDTVIEARAGKKIAQIFAEDGEPAFRELEHKIVKELAMRDRTVISTGGGLVVNPENMASLKQHAFVVCLWARPEAIYARVKDQNHRPLLKDPEPLERIRALLTERAPFYKQADVLLNTEIRSPREVAQQVLHQFRVARTAPVAH